MLIVILAFLCVGTLYGYGQDLSARVRDEILSQGNPVTVNVSTNGTTTLQFPSAIQTLESDGFSQKPSEETAADFYISPGINWVSIRSLHAGAAQNLNVVISGKVYPIWIQTSSLNDFAVLFRFAEQTRASRKATFVWSPPVPR